MLPGLTGFEWNPVAHRYIDSETGQFVGQAAVRESLENLIDLSAANMNTLTQSLVDGGISLADWQTGMMSEIKAAHVASGALANGGWGNMTQSDWGTVGHDIRDQYDYLRNFAAEVANGTQSLDGRALVRADLYGDAVNGTYNDIRTRSFVEQGYDEGRRVLEVRDDGNCDDCIEYAADGWMPIEDIPAIGDSQCQVRCRCEIEFRRSTEAESEE